MAFNILPTGMSFQRLGQFPLDSSSTYNTLAEAMAYVQNNPTAYPGQVLYVADARSEEEINAGIEASESLFMVTANKELKLVVSKKDLDMNEMVQEVENKVAELQGNLNNVVDDINGAMEQMQDVADEVHADLDAALQQQAEENAAKLEEMKQIADEVHAGIDTAMEEMKAEADAEHEAVRELMDIQKPYMADVAAYPTSKFLFACGNPMTVEPNTGHKYDDLSPEDAVAFVYRWAEGFEAIVVEKADAEKVYVVGGHGIDKVHVKRPIPQTNILVRDVKIKGIVGGSYFEGMVGHANIEANNCEFVSVMGAGWCGAAVDGSETRMNITDDVNIKMTNCKISSTLFGGAQGNGVADDVHMELNDCEIGWLTAGGSNGMTRNAVAVMNGGSIKVAQSTNRGIVHRARFVMNNGVVNKLYFGGETEDTTVNGIIEDGFVELNGGNVKEFCFGTNNGVEMVAADIKGSMRECVVDAGDVSMLDQPAHMFFGGDANTVPCASLAEVKALAGKERIDVKEVVFVVPADSQRVTVAVPEDVEIEEIQYMGQGCVDYKDMFNEEIIEGYRVMTYIFAIPCSAKMAFKIVLG